MKRKYAFRPEFTADTRFAQVAALTPPPDDGGGGNSREQESGPAAVSENQDIGTSATRMMPAVEIGFEEFPLALPFQNLLHDPLLQNVQRVVYFDRLVPILGGILLTAQIGKGGMGTVYYGVHTRLHIGVAVKVLDPNMILRNPELVARFHREAQLAARVRSSHLVGVIDVNHESDLDFIVMEFVVGLSAEGALLEAFRNKKMGLSERAVLEMGLAAARGLGDAHKTGVVHRDLKPVSSDNYSSRRRQLEFPVEARVGSTVLRGVWRELDDPRYAGGASHETSESRQAGVQECGAVRDGREDGA